MKFLLLAASVFSISTCLKKPAPRPAALPDNVVSDKPIVLKEGQAVVFMKAGDRDLMVAAAVVDGKLSIGEVDPKGRNFSVTWTDSETWETATEFSDKDRHQWVWDKNMDGMADHKVEVTTSERHHYEAKSQEWRELEIRKKAE
jgi:hypothetical protein